jgi:hypothetical protein
MRAGEGLWITRQLAAAVDVVELLLDLSLEPDFSVDPDFSLDPEDFSPDPELEPLSPFEEPLVELFELLEDSRLSVR